jgi:hypothetical protein
VDSANFSGIMVHRRSSEWLSRSLDQASWRLLPSASSQGHLENELWVVRRHEHGKVREEHRVAPEGKHVMSTKIKRQFRNRFAATLRGELLGRETFADLATLSRQPDPVRASCR